MRCLLSWAPSRSEMEGCSGQHQPVLLDTVLEALAVRTEGIYVDATFGRGGHSQAIVERLGPSGRLLAMDRDPEAIRVGIERFAADGRVSLIKGRFSLLGEVLRSRGWQGKVDGILLDLGVSSPQLDDPQRGFSFMQGGRLDMRMDPEAGISAAEWIAYAKEHEMARIFRQYGEERYAGRVAQALVQARQQHPIETTEQLATLVARAVPIREPGKHPATRTFQAIRILINDELKELESCLKQIPDALAPGGRLVVLSFHSLEDRVVKRFIRSESRGDVFPSELPVLCSQLHPRLRSVGGPVHPTPQEVAMNPRARSAVMRVAERLP